MTESNAANPVTVVTVDGPSGSGKGTLALHLARRLGWHYLDSGALYRILAHAAMAEGLLLGAEAESELAELAGRLRIDFRLPEPESPLGVRVEVDGVDCTDAIRAESVSQGASKIAALPLVRQSVLALQHRFRQPPGLVTDGRDMGTVVFPDAGLKLFLDASAEERAQRRHKQLKDKGSSVSLRALLASIRERDERDRGRAVAPLRPAPDAIVIDSTDMPIDEVFDMVWQLVVDRGLAQS